MGDLIVSSVKFSSADLRLPSVHSYSFLILLQFSLNKPWSDCVICVGERIWLKILQHFTGGWSHLQTLVHSTTSDGVQYIYAPFSCWMYQMTVEHFPQHAAASVKLLGSLSRYKTLLRDDVFIPVSLPVFCCGSFSRLKYCTLALTLSSASLWIQSQTPQVIFPHTLLLSASLLLSSSSSQEATSIWLWLRAELHYFCCWFHSNLHKYYQYIYGFSSLWFTTHFPQFCDFCKMLKPIKYELASLQLLSFTLCLYYLSQSKDSSSMPVTCLEH